MDASTQQSGVVASGPPGRSTWSTRVAIGLSVAGSAAFCLLGSLALHLVGTDTSQDASLQVLCAVAGAALVTTPLKLIVRRPRPPSTHRAAYWPADRYAFPAGHPARTSAVTVALIPLAGGALLWGLIAWTIAVGLSRLWLRAHHAGDVLAGWATGFVVGMGIWLLR